MNVAQLIEELQKQDPKSKAKVMGYRMRPIDGGESVERVGKGDYNIVWIYSTRMF